MHKKIYIVVAILFIVLVCIISAIFFLGGVGSATEKYNDQIHIECYISDIADTDYVHGAQPYTTDQEKFYRFDDSQTGALSATAYSIENYVPYKITVHISNDSKIAFSGKHLSGIYSDECVFTEISNISYWTGSIAPYTKMSYDMVIWFNKDLSDEQISQCVSSLSCSYQLLGNFLYFENSLVEHTILIPCSFSKDITEKTYSTGGGSVS